MPFRYVVVDGSNIATEGRSLPSLTQLDHAVQEFQREFPHVEITVVVDASFGHRIDKAEVATFEEAEVHAEVVSPPAGAIGRGDAFLLRIAEKMGATVLSNDSFQEFHGEHEWLFEPDRLIGGKPVPGVGWIFTPRTPVRGPKSRVAVKDARRSRVRVGSKEASQPMPVPAAPPPRPADAAAGVSKALAAAAEVTSEADAVMSEALEVASGDGGRAGGAEQSAREVTTDGNGRGASTGSGSGGARPRTGRSGSAGAAGRGRARVARAIEVATEEVVAPDSSSARRRRRRREEGPPPQAVNEPLSFITFIAEHPLGSQVEGEVDSFTSHGAFVSVGDVRAYVPLSALGDPPPRSAREVLSKGEIRLFVLQALDPPRRGLELALPEFAQVAGEPSEETVEAEITGTEVATTAAKAAKSAKSAKARGTATTGETASSGTAAETAETAETPRKATRARRATKTPAVEVADSGGGGTPAGEPTETAAPVKRSSARKAPRSPAKAPDQAPGEGAQVPAPAARKATRTRGATKSPAPLGGAPLDTPAGDDQPAKGAGTAKGAVPAKKATRARKAAKAAALEVASEGAETPAHPETPAGESSPARMSSRARKAPKSQTTAPTKAPAKSPPKTPAADGDEASGLPAKKATRPRKATRSAKAPSEKAVQERQ